MELLKLLKLLSLNKIDVSIHYDVKVHKAYLDLNTQAKSHCYIYEDGTTHMRYNKVQHFDLSLEEENLLRNLCYLFVSCLHGRNYYQEAWGELCKKHNIKLGLTLTITNKIKI